MDRAAWLIYALGGGWGHLTRAAALARAAGGRHRVRILTNSPYAALVRHARPKLDIVALDPRLPVAAARAQAVDRVSASRCGRLIVDTFPRGLGGELAGVLASLDCTKVLVHRDLNPRYVRAMKLREFVESHYDLVLVPGEHEGGAFRGVATAPWLASACPGRPAPAGAVSPRMLVCAGGSREELAWYGEAASLLLRAGARVRCVAAECPPGCPAECWIQHWPAMELFGEADVVVGGAGYNTVYECLGCGIPQIARPWPRTYDRQWLRARRAAQSGTVIAVKTPDEAAAAAFTVPYPAAPIFRDGAAEAVAHIEGIKSKTRAAFPSRGCIA